MASEAYSDANTAGANVEKAKAVTEEGAETHDAVEQA